MSRRVYLLILCVIRLLVPLVPLPMPLLNLAPFPKFLRPLAMVLMSPLRRRSDLFLSLVPSVLTPMPSAPHLTDALLRPHVPPSLPPRRSPGLVLWTPDAIMEPPVALLFLLSLVPLLRPPDLFLLLIPLPQSPVPLPLLHPPPPLLLENPRSPLPLPLKIAPTNPPPKPCPLPELRLSPLMPMTQMATLLPFT